MVDKHLYLLKILHLPCGINCRIIVNTLGVYPYNPQLAVPGLFMHLLYTSYTHLYQQLTRLLYEFLVRLPKCVVYRQFPSRLLFFRKNV